MNEYECENCRDFHGEECLTCVDNLTCSECVKGHYLEDGECHICAEKFDYYIDCVFNEEATIKEN